jgi:hypothetical protein
MVAAQDLRAQHQGLQAGAEGEAAELLRTPSAKEAHQQKTHILLRVGAEHLVIIGLVPGHTI